jgi:predicted dienelactone hydrolase
MSTRTRLIALAGAVAAVGALVAPAPAHAQANPFQRGPAPTATSVTAERGTFAIATQTVARQTGFNGGTIYYPTSTGQTFGVIVATPGFTEGQNVQAWAANLLASNGFVVMTINTNTILDFPTGRSNQMRAAMTWLTSQSPAVVRDHIDASRQAFIGHSMGGGGTLESARAMPDLQAAVGLQPWDIGQNFSTIQVPTMIIGAASDPIAPAEQYSKPFYRQIPDASEKAYLEIAGAGHFVGTRFDPTEARSMLSWLKRYVDNDTRYEQFLCPPPAGAGIEEYQDTCPA